MTTANADFELTAASGTLQIPLMLLKATDEKGRPLPRTFKETLTATVDDSPVGEWLESFVQEDWSHGVGAVKDGYNMAPGCYARTPGYVMPAGAATSVVIPALNNSVSPLVAIEEFGSDLFIAQEGTGVANTARVIRSVGGTGAGAGLFANSLNLGAGRRVRDLILFGGYLYCVSDNGALGAGELHRWDGAAWSLGSSDASFSGALFTSGRYRTAKVNWSTDGTPGHRLVSIDGTRTVAYTKPNANPMLQTSWVEGVEIGTGFSLVDLTAARKHAWFGARDGLFDLDEQGNSPNLLGYSVKALQAGIPFPVFYHDGYVYVSLGYQLDRVFVGANEQLQENPGSCAPGLYTGAENEWHGYVTAMCEDQGWLVCAVFNPVTFKTGIFWGKDRTILGMESPNPLIWHGPECHSDAGYRVTKMRTSSLAGGLRMWLCSVSNLGTPTIDWVSLPSVGTPLNDLISNGQHRFATGIAGASAWNRSCQLHSMPDTAGDKAAYKTIYQNTFGTRGLPVLGAALAGTEPFLTTYARADPAPGSTAWGIGTNVVVGPTESLTPALVTGGFKLEYRVDLFAVNGAATPPLPGLLDAVRIERWRSVTTFRILHLTVAYGDGVSDLYGAQDDTFSPDQITEMLKDVAAVGRTTLRLPNDDRYTVKVRQILDSVSTVSDSRPYGKRVQATLEIALLSKL